MTPSSVREITNELCPGLNDTYGVDIRKKLAPKQVDESTPTHLHIFLLKSKPEASA